MSMTTGHASGLLSSPLAWVWLAVYGAIVLSHARCVAVNGGPHRVWHAAHCVMAIAMADMFAPGGWHLASATAWRTVFLVLTALIVFRVAQGGTASGPCRFVWALTGIDMAAMVYMIMSPAGASQLIPYALGGYFVLQACAWIAGRVALDGVQRPEAVVALGYKPAGAAENRVKSGDIVCSVEHRIVLGAMSAGMAYMFMAMAVGM